MIEETLWAGESDDTPPEHQKKQCYGTPTELRIACERYCTKWPSFDPCPWKPKENGLKIEWSPFTFLNPPYGKGMLQKWLDKAIEEYESGRTDVVIWVINYANSRACSEIARRSVGFVHVTGGRVSFLDPLTGKPRTSNDRDSAIYIWDRDGLDVRAAKVFGPFGEVFEKR